jgi:ribonuclease P protein subunit POP4
MNQKINRQNLLQHELIGLPVKVVRSLNPSQESAEGKVLNETMKTLTLGNQNTKRMIPKEGTTFRLTLIDGSKVEVSGNQLLRRPEDRVKMIRGRRR